jgi:hypothetical protein
MLVDMNGGELLCPYRMPEGNEVHNLWRGPAPFPTGLFFPNRILSWEPPGGQ